MIQIYSSMIYRVVARSNYSNLGEQNPATSAVAHCRLLLLLFVFAFVP
jgi:hypothetical protein